MEREEWKIMGIVLAAIALIIMFAVSIWPANAQEGRHAVCQPPDVMANLLKNKYNEVVVGWGVDTHGKRLIQLFASQGGATWSIIVRYAGQNACLVAGGRRWETMPGAPGEQAWLRPR